MIIAIVVALKAEATALIAHLQLKPFSQNSLFPIWENEEIKLTLSGVGKIRAAAAVSYLAAIYRDETIYGWLNIGIGGHREFEIGTPKMIHKVSDSFSSFFPSFAFVPPCDTAACITVDKPNTDYPSEAIYEMEATGFYSIAAKLAPPELIHIVKVISDNKTSSPSHLTKEKIISLMEKQNALLENILNEMRFLIKELSPPNTPFLETFLKKWYFTTCETHQLKKTLKRWEALRPDQIVLSQEVLKCQSAKEVLRYLEDKLNNHPLLIP